MNAAELSARVLETPGGSWFDGVARPLALARWRAVTGATSLDRSTYGTERYARGDASAPRDEVARLTLPEAFAADGPVVLEALRGDVRDRYLGIGLDLQSDGGSADVVVFATRLREAFGRLERVPAVAVAVGALLAVVHVLRPEGLDYDVSYSDPTLPFSIFVGVERSMQPQGDLRLAEGILHECMHLQLSLIEELVPMVGGDEDRLYSPWQGTMRPAQGVLHGLYVFRVIEDFCEALVTAGGLSREDEAYLRRRMRLVRDEVEAVRDLAHNRDLTHAGRRLSARLLHPR